MKITLQIELEYDEGQHGDDESVRDWWVNGVLCAHKDLVLHSNDIGDSVGDITAVRVVPNAKIRDGEDRASHSL